jgi:uncharacterized protein
MSHRDIRVLDVNDDRCILFNGVADIVSEKLPGYVGRCAKIFAETGDLAAALASEPEAQGIRREWVASQIAAVTGPARPEPAEPGPHELTRILTLCPSAACQLRCVYCYGGGEAPATRPLQMDWPMAKAACDYYLDHIRGKGASRIAVKFHGGQGEPMANPDIVKRVTDYLRGIAEKRGARFLTRMTTNGCYSEELARWVGGNIDLISHSFDGPPDIQNAQRPMASGGGSYETARRSLELFEQSGHLYKINSVVTSLGIDRMEEILRHFRSISQVRQIRLLAMEYCGRCEISGVEPIDFDHYADKLAELLPLAKELDFTLRSVYEGIPGRHTHYCGGCGYGFVAHPDGTVSTCHEAAAGSGLDELIVGRYEDGAVRIDWEKMQRLRERAAEALPECRQCTWRTNCAGNCLARAARQNGTVFSVDSNACKKTKRFFADYIISCSPG